MHATQRGRLLGLFGFIALAAPCASSAADGPAGAPATAVLRPFPSRRPNYGESFTFVGDLDDGTYVQLSLSLTNLGPGSTKGICRAKVVPPEGTAWMASTRIDRNAWSWKGGGGEPERLAVGPCSAWADATTAGVEVALDGGSVRLVFAKGPVPRPAVRDAAVVVRDATFRAEVLLYRAPVTATVAIPDKPPRTVQGAGYADHSRGTVPARDLARRWIRFRALRGDRGLLLLGREGRDGRFAPMWACGEPGDCHEYGGFRIEPVGSGSAPAFQVTVWSESDPVEIRSERLLYREAPVEELGVLGKLVAPFTGSPVTYVYRARAQDGDGAPVDGILEVELGSE